jgi:drug/metabolite transporter superfamily protein YnfA
MIEFLSGAVTALYTLIALCFLKFWRRKRDRLFLLFGLAFVLLALNQIGTTLLSATYERYGYIYVLRVLGFSLILYAIVDKNTFGSRK